MRKIVLLLVVVLLIGSVPIVSAEVSAEALPAGMSSHLVTLKAAPTDFLNVSAAAMQVRTLAAEYGITPKAVWGNALVGFSANLTAAQVKALRADPAVAFVEPNAVVQLDPFEMAAAGPMAAIQEMPTGIMRVFAFINTNIDIDQLGGNVNADVAVLDTGSGPHNDLRVLYRVTCLTGTCVAGGNDGHGHGTHVAGTVGARDNTIGVVGVAPGVRIWSVQVLNSSGSGSWESVVAGVNYVVANKTSIEVANMSLSGAGTVAALNTAITNAVNNGVVVVVAAGNNNSNAANYSPANAPDAFTVSAISDFNGWWGGGAGYTCYADVDDTGANYSNWGAVVDIAAPGTCITSTYLGNSYASGWYGTSMAAPHVAGAAALLASRVNPNNRTAVINIWNTLKNYGTLDWVDDSGDGVKEKLLAVHNTTAFNPILQ